MAFEEDDRVVLHDKHSEYDGEDGTIEQVVEDMFGDEKYTVSFEDGQEAGVPEDSLEAAEESGDGFAEDDRVVLHDQHSEYDGEEGTIEQVVEDMFGDQKYTISFEDGQEAGVPEDSLEAAE